MTEEKEKQIVELVAGGASQGDVARRFRVTQQMVSKIWRAAIGASKGKRGGKRRGHVYEALRAKRAQKINNQRKGE